VGLAILEPLKELDVVAYLRFASVYRAFESLADFEAEDTHRSERKSVMPTLVRYLLALLLLTATALLWPETLVEEVVVMLVLEVVLALLHRDRNRRR
jgi:hypothetical protein